METRRVSSGGRRRPLGVVVLLASVLTACGSDDDSGSSDDTVATPTATEPDGTQPDATEPDATEPDLTEPDATQPDATEAPPESPRGGTLRIGAFYEPPFDPMIQTFAARPYQRAFYDPIIEFDADRNPQPWLATEWAIAADHRSVTITLRDDVTFWSGTPLTTETLIPTFEKAKNRDTGFNTFSLLQPLESWQAVDDHTIDLRFDRPLRDEVIFEMLKGTLVIDPAGIANLAAAPAGTGPFMIDSFEPGKQTRLVANPNYFVEGQPVLDEVIFVKFDDRDSMAASMEAGDLDMIFGPAGNDAKRLEGEGFSVVPQIAPSNVYGLSINATRPPFDNKSFRQAMNYVVDREVMVDQIFGGYAEPTVLPFAPGNIAFDAELVEEYAFDLDRARELIEGSGLAEGDRAFPLTYDSSNYAANLVAPALQANLAELGVEVTLEPLDNATFVQRVGIKPDYFMAIAGNPNPSKFPGMIPGAAIFRYDDTNPLWGAAIPPAYVDAMNRVVDPSADLDAAIEDLKHVLLDESWTVWMSTAPFLIAMHTDEVTGTQPDSDEFLRLHTVAIAS